VCEYDVDDVCADDADDADDSDVTVVLPADLAAELRGLVPGPLDAAVCAILRAWAVRAAANFGGDGVLNKD
jgi:hypothetical protein